MGRGSTKENKSVYQEAREDAKMSRETASEWLKCSADRVERLENGKTAIIPYDVVKMAEAYKKPELCNYFCTHDCQIGERYVKEVKIKDLAQIVLEMLATLNATQKKKDRLIEIAADGIISEEEMEDFIAIQEELEHVSMAVDSLELWIERTKASGDFNMEAYERLQNKK